MLKEYEDPSGQRGAVKLGKPIKVLYVVRPVSGGMRQHLIGLWQHLARGKVEPLVVCPPAEAEFFARQNLGLKIFPLAFREKFSLWADLGVALTLPRLAKTYGVEIIHAHGYKAGFLSLWAGLFPGRRYRLICTFHNPLRRYRSLLKNWLSSMLAGTVARTSDHLIVISNFIGAETRRRWSVPDGKISCIYNGINPWVQPEQAPEKARANWGVPAGIPFLGTVARLIPQKGVQYLIEAAAILRRAGIDFRMVVAGDGPFRAELEALADRTGLSGVLFFPGYLEDVSGLLAALDIFVLPTLEEGMSVAILEAMAAGKPVVASNVGGVPELVTAETGIVVPPADPERLAAALQQLIRTPERRRQMGENGRKRVTKGFTIFRMAEAHLGLYQKLLKDVT